MRFVKPDIKALLDRGVDRQLRLAVTGLSRSGKTAFITSFVHQLLMAGQGARLPLLKVDVEQRLLGVRRLPQRDLGIARFAYDQGIEQLYSSPADWPSPTNGISEIRLALRYRQQTSLWRHIKENATLFLEIIDYPGEWLLDLPMLEHDYFSWSRQMQQLLSQDSQRQQLAQPWLQRCQQIDLLAKADENVLTEVANSYTDYLLACKQQGYAFIQPGRFILPGDLANTPALQFFPWALPFNESDNRYQQASKESYLALLSQRFNYYSQKVVKDFYKDYFQHFDRQIVLVDCLQALNRGEGAFKDMRLAIEQVMQSFAYGQRSLLHRLFSPVIDKVLFAASKADHITYDQHDNLVSLLQQLVLPSRQHIAFEGIDIRCQALAAIQASSYGQVNYQGKNIPALQAIRLQDRQPLLFYPGEVPATLPDSAFWQQHHFDFEQFAPPHLNLQQPLPHIRLDSAIQFLLGDKLV